MPIDFERTDLAVQAERAFLVKVITQPLFHGEDDPLSELASLAKAAGAIVVGTLTQKTRKTAPSTCIGSGKVKELAELVDAYEADLVIFDNDLTPAQIRELEKHVKRRILDRSELILDIFASRAKTHEARLQVELAQLEYTAPRLRGMWKHLERIAGAGGGTGAGSVGAIGTRGPGERQIEIDRRIVNDRMAALRRDLAKIDERKVRTVKSRSDCFTVSLVGYTNSGKTTLMNRLTDAGQYAADKLFATLDTKTVRWKIDDSLTVLLSDTVGFVRDLPHRLVASFRATLEEALHADLLLHVIDASNPLAIGQIAAVRAVLDELECHDLPTVAVLNKMDAAEDEELIRMIESNFDHCCGVSAKTGAGIDELADIVRSYATQNSVAVTLTIPQADGRLISQVTRDAEVRDQRYENDVVEMDVVIDQAKLNHLVNHFPTLRIVSHGNNGGHAA